MGSILPANVPIVNNVPAGPQINVGGAVSANNAIPITPQPIASIMILNSMLLALFNDSKYSHLSITKDNWPKWKQRMLRVLGMSDLDDYILASITQSDANVDAVSVRNWVKTHAKTISFLQMHIEDLEQPYLGNVMNANVVWTNLLMCHEKQGPITQVWLIQEALSVLYSEDVPSWPETTDHLCDLCSCICAQVVPTQDVMFLIMMLNAL